MRELLDRALAARTILLAALLNVGKPHEAVALHLDLPVRVARWLYVFVGADSGRRRGLEQNGHLFQLLLFQALLFTDLRLVRGRPQMLLSLK